MVAREGLKPSSLCVAYRDSFLELSGTKLVETLGIAPSPAGLQPAASTWLA